MKYEWNSDKNEELKKERNISFEEIIYHLSRGNVWKTADHPDQIKYPGQKLYFVIIDAYLHRSPCGQQRTYFSENDHSQQKSD